MFENLHQILKTLQKDLQNLPELALFVGFLCLILTDILVEKHKKNILMLFFIGSIIITEILSQQNFKKEAFWLFSNSLKIDDFSVILRLLVSVSGIFTAFFVYRGYFLRESDSYKGETYIILMAMLIGLRLMCISVSMPMVFLSIETVSISSYALAYFGFKQKSSEASLKYLIFGGVASAVMLYGMSWLYGLTGTLTYTSQIIAVLKENPQMSGIAVLLFLGGFLFKLGIFPFHIWLPDVYQQTPTPLVAFFSVAPKIASIALLWHFFQETQFQTLLLGNVLPFESLLIILAIFTVFVGNLAAFWQKNIKRMMAYSSIANAGYLLAGVGVSGGVGTGVLVVYLIFYGIANFLIFGLIEVFYQKIQSENIDDYAGLGSKMPFLGVLWLIGLLTLAGLPPTGGFSAKLILFSAVWLKYETSNNVFFLLFLCVGILNTLIGLFFYLKIPYKMFFSPISENKKELLEVSSATKYLPENIILAIFSLVLLLLFFKFDVVF